LAQGNTGTQQDFLNSLQGATGATGSVGATGTPGANGNNGQNSLVKTTAEATGTNCASGGTKLEYGLDANNNGILDASEINTTLTKFICNGADGAENAWALLGNAGTDATLNFVGTTDNTPLIFKTNNTEKIRVTTAGNVGIGTSSPLSKLHVLGDFILQDKDNSPYIFEFRDSTGLIRGSERINWSTTSTNFDLDVYSPTSSTNANIRFFRNMNTTGPKNVSFCRGNNTTQVSALIGIDGVDSYFQNHGGNFGIGTATPLGKLHVNNDVSGSDSSFVVTNAGNVGIGTSSPTEKIEIQNGGIRINGFNGIGFNDQPFANSTPNGNEGAKIYFDNTIMNDPNKDYLVIEKKDGSSSSPDGGIVFANRGNNGIRSNSMIIDGSGKVGIGTNTPARTLHVSSVMRLEPIATAPTSPAKGDMYFDSTINKLRVYDGTTWQSCW